MSQDLVDFDNDDGYGCVENVVYETATDDDDDDDDDDDHIDTCDNNGIEINSKIVKTGGVATIDENESKTEHFSSNHNYGNSKNDVGSSDVGSIGTIATVDNINACSIPNIPSIRHGTMKMIVKQSDEFMKRNPKLVNTRNDTTNINTDTDTEAYKNTNRNTINRLLQRNMNDNCNGDIVVQCHVCKIGFKNRSQYTKHIATHVQERAYQCGICFKRFRTTKDFAKHFSRHGNGK